MQKHDQEIQAQQQHIQQQQQEISRNRQLLEELKRRDLEAIETERGVVVNLPDVLFEFGASNLTSNALARVDNIANVLNNQARSRRVAIEGHTDAVGSDAANQKLSERRAEAVANVLEAGGVSSQRLTIKGYGERYPVATNTGPDGSDNPAGRAKNRRVEVVIEN
jgi:outer membrane protein OmpA-like peptidoglycan-associated protein